MVKLTYYPLPVIISHSYLLGVLGGPPVLFLSLNTTIRVHMGVESRGQG